MILPLKCRNDSSGNNRKENKASIIIKICVFYISIFIIDSGCVVASLWILESALEWALDDALDEALESAQEMHLFGPLFNQHLNFLMVQLFHGVFHLHR